MSTIDYYNCSPCDFYSEERIAFEHGYKWDEKEEEYVLIDEQVLEESL